MPREYSAAARKWMVDAQLATNHIENTTLRKLFAVTPREVFLPESLGSVAYADEALPLGNGRFAISPLALATLIASLHLQPSDRVLIIGGAMGYSAAIIGQLAARVVLVDEARFIDTIGEKLIYAGCRNVQCVTGALEAGAETEAPFDVILIEGAVETLPAALIAQLREAGRIAYGTIIAASPASLAGEAALICAEKRGESLVSRPVGETSLPRLPSFHLPQGFVFS
jgi:protein-L-isoaspartate(D-aspartate) O-methyltransferase